MRVSSTVFESNYYSSVKHYGINVGEYVRHNIDIWNEIIIEENGITKKMLAMYQTGCRYIYNDYSLPSPNLELSQDSCTDELLCKIDKLSVKDFDDKKIIDVFLAENKDDIINTSHKLWVFFGFLRNNKPMLDEYLPEEFEFLNE